MAATAAVLVAALGCSADGSKDPGQQLASPVTPLAQQQLTISSSRSTLTVGRDDITSTITVQALAPDFTPLPNGTPVLLNASLGVFDSPSGSNTITLLLSGGKATAKLYPGTVEGTARVSATVNSLTASVTLTIKPEPDPAPVQAAFTVVIDPTFVAEDVADDTPADSEFVVTAKIINDDGKAFRGGGVYFVADNIGSMASSGVKIGDTLSTNSNGEASDTLIVEDGELLAFQGSSFSVTAHFLIEGGETTRTVSVSIIAGSGPPVATSVTLSLLPDANVNDSGPDSVTLRAVVRDQNSSPFEGETVEFQTQLGTLTAFTDTSDGGGVAEVTLNLTQAEMETYGANSFVVTAKITADSESKVVTISRTPEVLDASFTASTTSPCVNNSALSKVQFTDTSTGTILTWSWDLDGNGSTTDSNVADPLWDYFGFPSDVDVNVTLIVSDGVQSSSQSMIITPVTCL